MQNRKYIRICPKCKSSKVIGNILNLALGIPNFYKCADCGYSGQIFPEVSVEKVEGKKKRLRNRALKTERYYK